MAAAKLADDPLPKRRIVRDWPGGGHIERNTGGGSLFVVAGRTVLAYEPFVGIVPLRMERAEDAVGSEQARQPASARRGSNEGFRGPPPAS